MNMIHKRGWEAWIFISEKAHAGIDGFFFPSPEEAVCYFSFSHMKVNTLFEKNQRAGRHKRQKQDYGDFTIVKSLSHSSSLQCPY